MPYTLKTNQISVKDPETGEYSGVDILAEQTEQGLIAELQAEGTTQVNRINQAAVDVQAAVDQAESDAATIISSTQTSINTLEAQKNTIAQTVASMAELGTDTTFSTPGMAADAGAVGDLSRQISDVEEGVDPYRINIADPSTPYVNLYFNGTQFFVANFVYMLPIKVKKNTTYTVMQQAPISADFHIGLSPDYPALNGSCTQVGTTSPAIVNTGDNEYIDVIYYNSRKDGSPIGRNTVMIAEGSQTEFVEYTTLNPINSDVYNQIVDTTLSQNTVTIEGAVIADEFVKGSAVFVTTETSQTIRVSGENLLIPSDYETLTSKTVSGITFTVNSDLSITASGTASGNADFYFKKAGSPAIVYPAYTPICFTCLPEITDTQQCFAYLNPSGVADDGGGIVAAVSTSITNGYIRVKPGSVISNVTFKPMLSVGPERKEFVTPSGTYYSSVTDISVVATGEVMSFAGSSGGLSVTGVRSVNQAQKILANETIKARHEAEYRKPYIISAAHRGLLAEAPENTIYAFRAAIEAGCDILESDIQFTSDGVPVMFHDTTIDRVVDGYTGAISSYTWAQVQAFDVYTYFQTEHPDKWKEEFTNARVMSLEEYLVMAKGFGVKSTLEIKKLSSQSYTATKYIQTVVDLLNEYDYADKVLWQGSAESYLYAMRLLPYYPEMDYCIILTDDPTATDIKKLEIFNTGKNALGFNTDHYNSIPAEYQDRYVVLGYTVNDAATAIQIKPYVDIALSNSLCVKDTLKDYYMNNMPSV